MYICSTTGRLVSKENLMVILGLKTVIHIKCYNFDGTYRIRDLEGIKRYFHTDNLINFQLHWPTSCILRT